MLVRPPTRGMPRMTSDPLRGEVWIVDIGLAAKVRPALVISVPVEDTDRALVTVLPHTTSGRETRFEVEIKTSFLKPGVFDAQNLVTIPHAKLVRRIGNLSSDQLKVVETILKLWLGLT